MRATTACLIALVVCASATVAAEPDDVYANALRAFEDRHVHEAAKLFEKAAESRELPLGVQRFMGIYYVIDVRDTAENRARALHWLKKPADSGDAWAQYYYGKATRSPGEKVKYFEMAVQQGLTAAAADLMRLYRDGEVQANPYRACLFEEITSRDWADFRSWHEATNCLAVMSTEQRAKLLSEANAIWKKRFYE